MRISSNAVWLSMMVLPALIWGQAALAECGAADVVQSGKTFTVLPTGTDDTLNIQCAFDKAIAAGRGATVKLIEGTYLTEQIVVRDFDGRFTGEGADRTVVQNQPLHVSVVDFLNYEPCPAYGSCDDADDGAGTWPTIFAFIGGDFTVSDMTIRAVGDRPTDYWEILGSGYNEILHAVLVLGAEARVGFHRGRIEGEVVQGAFFGTNLINGIVPTGDFGGYLGLQSGRLVVKHSTFRNLVSAVVLPTLQNYRASMHHNHFDTIWTSLEGCHLVDTDIKLSHNWVNADPSPEANSPFDEGLGVIMYDCALFGDPASDPVGLVDSTVVIKDNRFQGDYGPFLDISFDGEVRCRLFNNNVSDVESVGIYLGEGTRDCVVRGSGPDAVIDDLGDNDVRDH